jgi:hypothetical protein
MSKCQANANTEGKPVYFVSMPNEVTDHLTEQAAERLIKSTAETAQPEIVGHGPDPVRGMGKSRSDRAGSAATMTNEPPLCPPGGHDFVCFCGDSIDSHYPGDGHTPVSLGCAYCHRTPADAEEEHREATVISLGFEPTRSRRITQIGGFNADRALYDDRMLYDEIHDFMGRPRPTRQRFRRAVGRLLRSVGARRLAQNINPRPPSARKDER